MLQNLRPSDKKEKMWKRWNKSLNKEYPEDVKAFGKHNVLGYNRFHKYIPRGDEFTLDTHNNFTGVYVMEKGYGCVYPFQDISICTRSSSKGNCIVYGICDNASQVIDLYNAVFLDKDYSGDNDIINHWKSYKEHTRERFIEKPDNKFAQRDFHYWSGNHVIILHKMRDFRWHKFGPYIGNYKPTHEYFSDENNIKFVYSFEIYKVV